MGRRIPIMKRTSIVQRVAQGAIPISYSNCKLCDGYKDCGGYTYIEPDEDLEPHHKAQYRKMYVSSDYDDWDSLVNQMKILQVKGVNVRLVIDKAVPDYVIWAMCYSTMNIVQVNVDLLKLSEYVGWVGNCLALCMRCGLYSIVVLSPVVPTISKTYHIIEVIDNFRNMGNHVALRFADFPKLEVVDGYINVDGTAVPLEYLEETDTGFKCSELYMSQFLEIIKSYTTPHKISISICNQNEDCTGLGLEE